MRLSRALLLLAAVAPVIPVASARAQEDSLSAVAMDTLRGRSGLLRARLVGGSRDGSIALIESLFGDSAARVPGVYQATPRESGPFAFINMLPFNAKRSGRIGGYRLGSWPAERRGARGAVPDGFIQVTPENQDTEISENFRLRDFLTRDQQGTWPKYLVLREALIDKLELIIADLRERGHGSARLGVMSGFRTPQYNRQVRGRARDSRHQYGDAADVYVDANGDGRMDDLNRDGRVDSRDARMLLESVERVERAHPAMVGGAGVYRSTRTHGPFVHVDVRGTRVRWVGVSG